MEPGMRAANACCKIAAVCSQAAPLIVTPPPFCMYPPPMPAPNAPPLADSEPPDDGALLTVSCSPSVTLIPGWLVLLFRAFDPMR
jgi:hypothetical protein